MKDYFLKLFRYDHYANETILKTASAAGNPGHAVKLMAHVLGAQQVWLARCKQNPGSQFLPIWPDWKADELEPINQKNNMEWLDFLSNIDDIQLNNTFNYKNSMGVGFTNNYTDLLAHVINHGTHHRAQVGQILKNAGIEKLPATDYIVYLRSL